MTNRVNNHRKNSEEKKNNFPLQITKKSTLTNPIKTLEELAVTDVVFDQVCNDLKSDAYINIGKFVENLDSNTGPQLIPTIPPLLNDGNRDAF